MGGRVLFFVGYWTERLSNVLLLTGSQLNFWPGGLLHRTAQTLAAYSTRLLSHKEGKDANKMEVRLEFGGLVFFFHLTLEVRNRLLYRLCKSLSSTHTEGKRSKLGNGYQ